MGLSSNTSPTKAIRPNGVSQGKHPANEGLSQVGGPCIAPRRSPVRVRLAPLAASALFVGDFASWASQRQALFLVYQAVQEVVELALFSGRETLESGRRSPHAVQQLRAHAHACRG